MKPKFDKRIITFNARLESVTDDCIYVSLPDDPNPGELYDIDIEHKLPDDISIGDMVRLECVDKSIKGVSLFTSLVKIEKADEGSDVDLVIEFE